MKVLVFSDLHSDRDATQKIAAKLKEVDYGFCLGDLCQWGQGLEATAARLDVGTSLYLLPGNHETEEEIAQICQDRSHFHLLHGEKITIGETNFAGMGGGKEKGIGRFLLSNQEAEQLLSQFRGLTNLVVLAHVPPLDTAIDLAWGDKHIGSQPLRQFILDEQPQVVYSGHVHERSGESDTLGTTELVSVGQEGVILEI